MIAVAHPQILTAHTSLCEATYSPPTIGRHLGRIDLMAALGSRQLPMPNVTRITSLSQAHATLQHCWAKLSSYIQDHPATLAAASSGSTSASVTEQRQRFQTWLEQWEAAFTAFLTNAMATMNSDDITQSRILKANHLACTILVANNSEASPSSFEVEFNAIIDLSAAVLRSKESADSPLSTKSILSEASSASIMTTNLYVLDPLMLVISRCNKDVIRTRAAELLRLAPR